MPAPEIEPFRRPDWEPLPRAGCIDVDGRIIVFDDRVGLALLRFGKHRKIDEHASTMRRPAAGLPTSEVTKSAQSVRIRCAL